MNDLLNGFMDMLLTFTLLTIDSLPALAWLQVESFAGLIELISYSTAFMPWSTFFIALGIWIAFQSFRFTLSVVNWVIAKIPFIN